MEVGFADTFFKSFKRMVNRERWYWKTWDFIRYDFPEFIKNIWRFRKELWEHRWWDYRYTLSVMQRSLIIMEKGMHGGIEVENMRNKKIAKMQRAIEILEHIKKDDYIKMAEDELGEPIQHPWEFEPVPDQPGYSQLKDLDTPEEKKHNQKIYDRSYEIEAQEWSELWDIFKGQDLSEYTKMMDALSEEDKRKQDYYQDWYDGSNLKRWWD